MASVSSLGVHKPSALSFLVAEGILPPDPKEETFTWKTIDEPELLGENDLGGQEEELLITKHCVVWSRAGVIQRVFRFDVEKEPVTYAAFTRFQSRASKVESHESSAPTQEVQKEVEASGALNIPKQRAFSSKPKPASESQSESITDSSVRKGTFLNADQDDVSGAGRALVIFLKSHAHVFFLSGTSHIVHLPFEVDAIFPSIFGVILQRKLSDKDVIPPTPQLPTVPNNSFAFHPRTSSSSPPSSQPLANISFSTNEDSPFLPLLEDLMKRTTRAPEIELPRLYCLTDPLAEIGAVATITEPNGDSSRQFDPKRSAPFGNLDPKDNLLYVSPQDELAHSGPDIGKDEPLIFVVTENEDSGNLVIWTAVHVANRINKPRQHQGANASGTASRRSSSFTPGMGSGMNTPIARGATSMRDSFGGTKSRRHVSSDPTLDEISTNEQDDLFDSAFESSTLPAKSARRVSGLLARADLSTSHDRIAFSDLASAHTVNKIGRKGASFGGHGSRLSAGLDIGTDNNPKSHPVRGLRTSLDSVSLYEHQLDDVADESDSFHGLRGLDDPDLHTGLEGLRKEIALNKIYAMPGEGTKRPKNVNTRSSHARQILTLKAPKPSLGDVSDSTAIFMCLVDREARELLTLHIRVQFSKPSTQSQKTAPQAFRRSLRARVTGMTRNSEVVDVCRVGDGVCNRLLVLEESADGIRHISLQAPWSSPRKIELPSNLYLHNPYQIMNDMTLRERREGGLRRVLSRGPRMFVALQHSNCQGRFDAVDSEGTRHRLQLQLRPLNSLVRKMIRVSESILPSSAGDAEAILRGWWDTMSWVQGRSEAEAEADIEWTAVIVLLFSMGVAFTDDRRTETTPRQKKKKGALLRSSSGAVTDLDSWEAMMAQEASMDGTLPAWMQTEAWKWTTKEKILPSPLKQPRSSGSIPSYIDAVPKPKKSPYMIHCISIARDFIASSIGQTANGRHGYLPTASSRDPDIRRIALASILISLHILREELKLNILTTAWLHRLTPILTQIGTWLGWENWGKNGSFMLESEDMEAWIFEESLITGLNVPPEPFPPPSILQFIESAQLNKDPAPMRSLFDVASTPEAHRSSTEQAANMLLDLTPRTVALTSLLGSQKGKTSEDLIAEVAVSNPALPFLETLPESIAAPFREAIASCQAQPSTSWSAGKLEIIGRSDLAMLEGDSGSVKLHGKTQATFSNDAVRDVHSICHSVLDVETVGPYDGSAELDRQSITRLLFREDQRFAEAANLLHPLHYPVARCTPEAEWSDIDFLEAQQELAKVIAMRTLSLSLGRGLLFYSARLPLLTEKFPIHGFTLSCVMKPADTTVTADRNQFTEDKVSWAFFHAGVEAGLSISKNAKGIDTSWILFNKPKELTNRHAGFLLALGLNGHLRSIAKWVAFKYLTPKHTMTSIGLLLGLSASHLGSMDTLVTRLLSVHVTRMLPSGAAELNLSPLTQTSGIMGIGLLYCNTQHRRMSEIMLSEMENTDQDELSNPLDDLRDEGYRLAAGFALGYINLGRGLDLKGLHDMRITERLLTLAVGIRKISVVHILDKAAPAATVAIALIFMKTHDETLARKIDIPDTVPQFDYVRPDTFLLRTVARHLIMWNNIQANSKWISLQLPLAYQHKSGLTTVRTLISEDMPFFNIIAGLCLSIGLRFAGSGSLDVRNLLCHYLDQFMRMCRLPALSYDGKLARLTVRNCQDVVALATSCVMAGTGDLLIFRRLRSLHGRTDSETPYGSHLAAHFAIGVLFMGGGTHTFGTSNIAVASLLCAFYPLFPTSVLDNKPHLQAFRHFWVLATERRCFIARDVDTYRPLALPILVSLHTGAELQMTAPCILPELHTIRKIQTNDPEYWTVTIDLAQNSRHQAAFARHQSIYVRRRAAYDADASIFSATMQALNDAQSAHHFDKRVFRWIFTLPTFARFDRAEQALVLPAEAGNAAYKGTTRSTVVDDRLVLEKACLHSGRAERLWNLRVLLAWAEGVNRKGEEISWLGREVVESLRAALVMRRWRIRDG